MRDKYIAHYKPIVQEFCREMESGGYADLDKLPQPFLPLFGEGFERSSLRLAIVGRDTRGWGKNGLGMKDFIEREIAEPGSRMREMFDAIDSREFTGWGPTRHQFWGFAMTLLATIHGVKNWNVMKHGACKEILRSFAWGNANAVEVWKSTPHRSGVTFQTWQAAYNAGTKFNRISHLVEVLSPNVIIITWKEMNPKTYFEGIAFEKVDSENSVVHYRFPNEEIDIFHCPHPNNLRFTGQTGAVLERLRLLLNQTGLIPHYPEFLHAEGDYTDVVSTLRSATPHKETKYQLIERVAEELAKRDSFMSVPFLASLVNDFGHKTNYGTSYVGGRGSYSLVRWTYHRLVAQGRDEQARMVAGAFKTPNFEYAF